MTTGLPLLPMLIADVPAGLRMALDQAGAPWVDQRAEPAGGRFVLFDSRGGAAPELIPGQTAIDIHELRSGHDDDPFPLLLDERSARRGWSIGPLTVTEETAAVDKRELRRSLLRRLRARIEQAGGVWLCLGAFPFPYRGAFNFRIDHDDYQPDDFARTLAALAGHENACSHYVCTAEFVDQPAALAALRGCDVGAHGHHHHTYASYEDNLQNIGRSLDVLRVAGFDPRGYVAPHGRYNRGLARALHDLGLIYSSEFGLAYDEAPFLPAESRVWQAPVHPVCLGLFLDAVKEAGDESPAARRRAAELAGDYFQRTLRARYQAGEPAFFYCHPTGRLGAYPETLTNLFRAAAELGGLWRVTLTRFVEWWRLRSRLRIRVLLDGDIDTGRFTVHAARLPAGLRVAIEYWRGEHVAVMPLDEPVVRFTHGAIAFQHRRVEEGPRPVRVDQAESLRDRVRKYLDWERATPVDEINASTWRGWMKKTLRRIKD